MGYDFIFNDVQDRLDRFDNETFDASPIEMYAVATDMLFEPPRTSRSKAPLDLDAVRASTSLPLVTPPVEIDGHKYVDGGVADSVPIEYVLEEAGFDRAVVIVTQDRSYEKKPYEFSLLRALAMPTTLICSRLSRRATTATTSSACTCGSMSARAVRWSLLRKKPVEVGHVEHDSAKLLDLYIQGRQGGKSACLRKSKSSLSANDGEPLKIDNSYRAGKITARG